MYSIRRTIFAIDIIAFNNKLVRKNDTQLFITNVYKSYNSTVLLLYKQFFLNLNCFLVKLNILCSVKCSLQTYFIEAPVLIK